jgi:phosphoribosylamine---glycine ligase
LTRVLVVGSGAREHALAWQLAREGADVVVAPGNGGTPRTAPIAVTDVDALVVFARAERVDLTIVGPEVPLAAGIVDSFQAERLTVFGPTQAAARLESSKAWAKDFLVRHAIPTGRAEVVQDAAGAWREIERFGLPVAIKADGLAAGKGVFVAHTPAQVESALDQLFTQKVLGNASERVLIEEFLEGEELSVLAFSDGERLASMPPARDYKRLLDGDRGPNTGGMGGFTWPSYATPELLGDVERTILRPTLDGMAAEGAPYRGVLYAGLMLTRSGPKVIEFNCRFGDPEAQLILPLLDSSLVDICAAAIEGRLDSEQVRWRPGRTYGVVLAAPGYPDAPRLGDPIEQLDAVRDDVQVFHAGSRLDNGVLRTAGGRVLTLVSESRQAVYRAAEAIQFDGKQFRTDIAASEAVVASR